MRQKASQAFRSLEAAPGYSWALGFGASHAAIPLETVTVWHSQPEVGLEVISRTTSAVRATGSNGLLAVASASWIVL